jgi:AcrR family transcriptional regulator
MAQRKSGEVRREEIIETAGELLKEMGLASLTTRHVTARIGVGAGLLNHYFTWSDLRAAALERVLSADLETVLPGGVSHDPVDAIQKFISLAVPAEEGTAERLWVEAADASAKDPAIAVALQRCVGVLHKKLAHVFSEGVRLGLWACPDPEGAALRLIALHDGLISLLYGVPHLLSRSAAIGHMQRLVAYECGLEANPG